MQSQVLTFTVDNASNNPVMLKGLADIIPQVCSTKVMVQYFRHVLNLVVKVHHGLLLHRFFLNLCSSCRLPCPNFSSRGLLHLMP